MVQLSTDHAGGSVQSGPHGQ